jgi:hypothetical protein
MKKVLYTTLSQVRINMDWRAVYDDMSIGDLIVLKDKWVGILVEIKPGGVKIKWRERNKLTRDKKVVKLVGRDFIGKASFIKALDEGRLKWYKGK